MTLFKNINIGTRLIVTFLIAVLLSIFITATLSYTTARDNLKDQIQKDLSLLSQMKKNEISQYTHSVNARAIDFSSDGFIRNAIKDITANPITTSSSTSINSSKKSTITSNVPLITKSDLNNHLIKNKIILDNSLFGINILDLNGKVIGSTSDAELGGNLSNEDYFINTINSTVNTPFLSSVRYINNFDNTTRSFAVSTLITDKLTSQKIGLLVNYVKLDNLNAIITTGFNNSTSIKQYEYNSILTDKNGLVITSSLLNYNKFFTDKLTTSPISNCQHNKTINDIYLDSNSVSVLGASQCLDNGWISLIEINQDQAFAQISNIKDKILYSSSVILIVVLGIALLLVLQIVKPIKQLTNITKKVSEGDFSEKFKYYADDEIGQLGHNFEQMTKKLEEYSKDMKNKVAVSVQEIDKKMQEIQDKNHVLEDRKNALLNVFEDLEQERDKMMTILYSIGDAVFVIDKDYKITVYNDVCAQLSGFEENEAIGKKYNEVLKFIFEDNEKENSQFLKDSINKGVVTEMSNHTLLITKDGKRIPISDSAAPLKDKDGEVIGCVVVFRDVTKEREVDRAKTEFVSLASHQLRTPLTAINWYSEMLLEGDAGTINEEQKEYLAEISNGNKRMVELVNSLLNVSRIDLGTFAIDPQPTNFIEISDSVIKELHPQSLEKHLTIQKEYEPNIPLINADPKLVRIMFQNLLSNSVKYTPDNGTIRVTMTLEDPANILIRISDTGYGIPQDQQSKIFSKLFRADNVKVKDTEGTGLGLYILKSIINESGGKVWFESEENKGTTFFISLPLSGMNKKDGTKELA